MQQPNPDHTFIAPPPAPETASLPVQEASALHDLPVNQTQEAHVKGGYKASPKLELICATGQH